MSAPPQNEPHPLVHCPHCDHHVPAGEYCGVCGAHLAPGAAHPAHRLGAFAANPGEHTASLAIISTLFPHLPHRHSAPFRIALALAVALLILLGLLRLTGPAIAVAACAVPLLYLLYLYEVEVYEDEPVFVVWLTFGLGLLIGIGWALWTGPIIATTQLGQATGVLVPSDVVLSTVVFPLLAQLLMVVGALVLYQTRDYDEALDGFTFGAAGALGFTLSATIVNLVPELSNGLVSANQPVANALAVLQRGLLVPVIHASTTGLIAGSLWLRRIRGRQGVLRGWPAALPTAILIAVVAQVGLGLVDVYVNNTGIAVALYALVAAALLLCVRFALHYMLLAEATEVAIGPEIVCLNCHRLVPRMAFCPHCGIANRATPKTGPNRADRLAPLAPLAEPAVLATGATAGSARFPVADAVPAHPGRRPAWLVAGAVFVVALVGLGVTAAVLTPRLQAPRACVPDCPRPPVTSPVVPPTKQTTSSGPLLAPHQYTSSAYHYSLEYQDQPSPVQLAMQNDHQIAWKAGSYPYLFSAQPASGHSAQDFVDTLQQNNAPDATLVYNIPGAELGYTAGAGAVYDDTATTGSGQAIHVRIVIIAAVKDNLAIYLYSIGPYVQTTSQDGHPNPADTPIVDLFDPIVNTVTWPGQPPL